MRILSSARKHGIADEDMLHAYRYRIRSVEDEVTMYIGPSRDGRILEIGVVEDDDPRIIHAMPARRKFTRRL